MAPPVDVRGAAGELVGYVYGSSREELEEFSVPASCIATWPSFEEAARRARRAYGADAWVAAVRRDPVSVRPIPVGVGARAKEGLCPGCGTLPEPGAVFCADCLLGEDCQDVVAGRVAAAAGIVGGQGRSGASVASDGLMLALLGLAVATTAAIWVIAVLAREVRNG